MIVTTAKLNKIKSQIKELQTTAIQSAGIIISQAMTIKELESKLATLDDKVSDITPIK